MSGKIEDDILKTFLLELATEEAISPQMVEGLKQLLTSTGKLKPDDLVGIFAPPPEEDLP